MCAQLRQKNTDSSTHPLQLVKKRNFTLVELPEHHIVHPNDVIRICNAIEQEIKASSDHHNFILSFKRVEYISSMFIGKLMSFYKLLSQKQSKLMLCNLNEQLLTVIRLAKLEKQMAIYPNWAQAVTGRTPAITGMIVCSTISGLFGILFLVLFLASNKSIGVLHWIMAIYLLINLPLPGMIWFYRRKIAGYSPLLQWVVAALIVAMMLGAILIAIL